MLVELVTKPETKKKPKKITGDLNEMDPYEVLGIDKTADDETIKKAYYRQKKYHPDRNRGDPEKGEQFKKISTEHSMLTDKSFIGGAGFGGSNEYDFKFLRIKYT